MLGLFRGHSNDKAAPAPDDTAETLKKRVFDVMWEYYTRNAY